MLCYIPEPDRKREFLCLKAGRELIYSPRSILIFNFNQNFIIFSEMRYYARNTKII